METEDPFYYYNNEHTPFTEASRIIIGISFFLFLGVFFFCFAITVFLINDGTIGCTIGGDILFLMRFIISFIIATIATISCMVHKDGETIFVYWHILVLSKTKKPFSVKKRFSEILFKKASQKFIF